MARFLVVDDDHATVRALLLLLIDEGHHVVPFTSGAEAVEALSRETFDAVLTDLDMPGVDGHAVVGAARENAPDACLVVVTARAKETAVDLTKAGACHVVDKPLDFERVSGAIAECRRPGGPRSHGQCHMRSDAFWSPPGPATTPVGRRAASSPVWPDGIGGTLPQSR